MAISDDLLCLFHAEVEEEGDAYTFKIPTQEIALGDVQESETYRVAVLTSETTDTSSEPRRNQDNPRTAQGPEPPVEEGDTREVEIEDIGEQGDGIARIERGYIVFVEDTDIGDRVTIEITSVQQNFAFGDMIKGPY